MPTWLESFPISWMVHQVAFLKMYQVLKYVLDTKNLGLKLEPNSDEEEPWDIVYFSNSDYAGDWVMRRSVSGKP